MGSEMCIRDRRSTEKGGTPYGPSHVAGNNQSVQISDEEKAIAMAAGERLARLAERLR